LTVPTAISPPVTRLRVVLLLGGVKRFDDCVCSSTQIINVAEKQMDGRTDREIYDS